MTVLVLLSYALAAVFIFSTWQKVRAPALARSAATNLGIPDALAGVGVYPLCVAEALIALGLLIEPLHRPAAWASLVLLLAFTTLVAANLVRGNRPACGCFGALSQQTIGAGTIVRNAALTAAAGLLVISPAVLGSPIEPALAAHPGIPWLVSLVALLFAASSGWVAVAVLRRHGTLVLRVESLEQRLKPFSDLEYVFEEEPATPPTTVDLASAGLKDPLSLDPINLVELARTRSVSALLFVDSGCGGCRDVLQVLESGGEAPLDVLVTSATALPTLPGAWTARYDDPGLPRRLGCSGVPCLVPLDPNGGVAGPPLLGRDAVLEALRRHPQRVDPVQAVVS
ncbi:putative membrane protein YphA (DoxX/SURF4 family) [Microlunatus panaciterrae]|uniref:Membrane protein YphA (DoxX/SURF4 family) n=1 Tax=Microlunatus panaciterrae TaxID=400768 RepID=A0ABS2RLU9_9ACTN|nr:MauE/DoxX family redox-associated membrane protein [Microlunatus panaciterrae]MBM7799991.1 putative membrane protein YphA (DoxX/SURF4 family) [Microlunatus panaciterrae]